MKIIAAGDFHIGAATVSIDLIKKVVSKWGNTPIILMGDIGDYGYFKGMQFNQKYHPQEQVNLVEEIFKPLNVVGYRMGNHEARIYEQTGLNPYETIFKLKPTNYFRAGSKLIYFNHGRSTAKNIFLEHSHLAEWVRADVILLGHNHALAKYPYVTGEGKIVYYVRTGCFIGNANYAKDAGLHAPLMGYVTYESEKHLVHTIQVTKDGKEREI
jgi:predicted phosphodiesterase